MATKMLDLRPGPAGWVQARFKLTDDRPARVFVQFEPDPKGRWHAAQCRVPWFEPAELRHIPWERIRKAVQANDRVTNALSARLGEEAPPDLGQHAFGAVRRGEPFPLVRPKGRNLDDRFFDDVARAYRQAIGAGLDPRQAIADAAGVAPDTAGRWIYRARQKNKIPKTTAGKVTV
jgi:hypothetical protein